MKRLGRLCFFAAVNVLWIVMLAVGCEVYEVMRARHHAAEVEAYGLKYGAEAASKDQEIIARYASSPPQIGLDMRARESFAALDETARGEFAARRQEGVVLCDPDGRIVAVYGGTAALPAAVFVSSLHQGALIGAALPANESGDAAVAMAGAWKGNMPQFREYAVPLPASPAYALQFTFQPFPSLGQVGVFVRDSMWEVPWQCFRKQVHQNDSYDFHTNNVGFRGKDIAVPKPPGVIRILCVGGSTTAEGLTDELTYPGMLERKLQSEFGGRVEVVNGGIFAADSAVERKRLPDFLALQPDLIVHYNFVNDVTYHYEQWAAQEGWRFSLKRFLSRSLLLRRHANAWLMPRRETLVSAMASNTLANIESIVDGARQAKVDVALCSFACPDAGHISRNEMDYFNLRLDTMLARNTLDMEGYTGVVALYNEQVRALCGKAGLLYIPVAEQMRGGLDIFTDICHMRAWAMERKAEAVFQSVRGYVAARLAAGAEGKR